MVWLPLILKKKAMRSHLVILQWKLEYLFTKKMTAESVKNLLEVFTSRPRYNFSKLLKKKYYLIVFFFSIHKMLDKVITHDNYAIQEWAPYDNLANNSLQFHHFEWHHFELKSLIFFQTLSMYLNKLCPKGCSLLIGQGYSLVYMPIKLGLIDNVLLLIKYCKNKNWEYPYNNVYQMSITEECWSYMFWQTIY